jgi:hypothetical protein
MTLDEKMHDAQETLKGIKELEKLLGLWRNYEKGAGKKFLSIEMENWGFMERISGSMAETVCLLLAADHRRRALKLAQELGVDTEATK